MKCRRLATWKDEQGVEHKDVVWFGSMGINHIIRPDLTFANATWEEIQQVIDLGAYTKLFAIGDTKQFEYLDGIKTCRIIDFNHVDNSEVFAISLEIVESMGQYTIMNNSTSQIVNIYNTNFASICSTIYNNLPTDLQKIILTTGKTSLASTHATYNPSDPSMRFLQFLSYFNVFPFSITELNNNPKWQPGSSLTVPYYDEGELYEYYRTHSVDYTSLTRSGVSFNSPNEWMLSNGGYVNGTTAKDLHVGFNIGHATKQTQNIEPVAVWFNPDDKHDNYSDKQQGVVDSLTQRLSVIRRELWYDVNYGLPLLDKQKSKVAIDAFIGKTVLAHPDVDSIQDFDSMIINKVYTCSMKIITKYGEIILNV